MHTIYFGGGCFWCIEAPFMLLKGVVSVVSGYMGGHQESPDYESICSGTSGHAEVIKIVFDQQVISLDLLLQVFFLVHDPTEKNRQGNDVGTQYRSIIFAGKHHHKLVKDFIKRIDLSGFKNNDVETELIFLNESNTSDSATKVNEIFWPAENYHQNFYINNKHNPYCRSVIGPKLKKIKNLFPGQTGG